MEINLDLPNLFVEKIVDFRCLATFSSGIKAMDDFIQGDFKLSVENHYCTAYGVWSGKELIAIYALSYDSLDLDSDDKDELLTGLSPAGIPDIDWNYQDTFFSKPRYPAIDIAYLAVQKEYRGLHIGQAIIELIAEKTRTQGFAGCQFLTVEALATTEYSAVGFYDKCGFSANEVKKPYKDTLRMFRTLYDKDVSLGDEWND